MTFDWKGLKTARDNYVTRLNGIYSRGLDSAGVSLIEGLASFDSPTEVRVGDAVYTADHIMIATGGVPTFPVHYHENTTPHTRSLPNIRNERERERRNACFERTKSLL